MGKIKLNKKIEKQAFDVIPNMPLSFDEENENKTKNKEITDNNNYSDGEFVKEVEETPKKLFANKKTNIMLGISFIIMFAIIICLAIFANS